MSARARDMLAFSAPNSVGLLWKLALAILVIPLIPFSLALTWDDFSHVLGVYPPIVVLWAAVIAFAMRSGNKRARAVRDHEIAVEEARLASIKREADVISARRERDTEALARSNDRQIVSLQHANRELRELLSRSMQGTDSRDRWIAVLEANAAPEVLAKRPPLGEPVAAIDLATIFVEQSEQGQP